MGQRGAEWRSWAEFAYISDPDTFFVEKAAYMVDVLLADSYSAIDETTGDFVDGIADENQKWRVLILEDRARFLAVMQAGVIKAGQLRRDER